MHLILPYFIILIVIFQFLLRRNSKKNQLSNEEFWEKEKEANTVRKKSLDDIVYIHIPDKLLNICDMPESSSNYYAEYKELSKAPIVNLTGISNTDLKLSYGLANLPYLTECDDNFSKFCRLTSKIADCLLEAEKLDLAASFLEFAIDSGSDVTKHYESLAYYYLGLDLYDKIEDLKEKADQLNSLSRDTILAKLEKIGQK